MLAAGLKRLPLPWKIVLVSLPVGLLLTWLGWWQGTAAGPQVQVPMFYDAHYLFPRPWTQAQEAPGVPPPAQVSVLYGPNRLSQPFVLGTDRLSMLKVWLAGPVGLPVQVALQAEDGRVYAAEIRLESEAGDDYFLTLPTLIAVEGRRFLLTLAAPQASIDRPVSTHAVGGDRLQGSVRVNEYSHPGNLVLSTYAQGPPGAWWLDLIGEQLLPGVFALRLQQYKVQPFKGATFALLLAATMLLSFGFLVLSRPATGKRAEWAGWVAVALIWAFLAFELLSARLVLPVATDTTSLKLTDQDLLMAPGPDEPFRLVHDLPLTLWTAAREPEARFVQVVSDPENRSAIEVPAESALAYQVTVPLNGNLRTGFSSTGGAPIRFTVRVGQQTIASQTLAAAQETAWFDLDLSAWAGQTQSLHLLTETTGDPQGARALWIMPQIQAEAEWLLEPRLETVPAVFLTNYEFRPPGSDRPVFLAGYRLEPAQPKAGSELEVTLYWYTEGRTDEYATVFVHLLDESGTILAQDDRQPVRGTYPLPAWQPGTIIADSHSITVPGDLVAKRLQLAVGLYSPDTQVRWSVTGPDGERLPDGRVLLGVPALGAGFS